LLHWCDEGDVVHLRRGESALGDLALLLPEGIEGDVLAGPLHDPTGPRGVLLLVAPEPEVFDEQHRKMAQLLLEPFSAALGNDQRLREMAAMQAAAEADNKLLLTKLGRKEIADAVIGVDSGLRAVMDRVELVAKSDVPVLILGETGTGKELIARMIHTQSPRSAGPFMRVNCGAIPLELIDSQLFGHERGAFTGAVATHEGWFERADRGTLLLDEIGELPLAAQVRLLRILQDGWLERVGGHQPINVNVRIVAATHRDLAAMVSEGSFREDLWYRIAVFPVHLPPLRARCEDIPELARHFAQRAATRFVLPAVMPSAEDIELLMSYPWPGNIRELGAVIDRAAILGDGKRLEVAKALGIGTSQSVEPLETNLPRTTTASNSVQVVSLNVAMKRHIEAVLSHTKGQIEGKRGAAALLAINPHTLRARMRKLGIEWSKFREND
jgi:transcriptional regulator with GAF, ATPase, and Fis domain